MSKHVEVSSARLTASGRSRQVRSRILSTQIKTLSGLAANVETSRSRTMIGRGLEEIIFLP